MSKRVELGVRSESAYGKATEFMRKKQVYTKTDLVNFFKDMGKSDSAALASAVVMLSPRNESKRGDCRGNMSNPWGNVAYNEKLKRKVNKETGKKEEQSFRFRFRAEALEPLTRKTAATEQEKEVVQHPVAVESITELTEEENEVETV